MRSLQGFPRKLQQDRRISGPDGPEGWPRYVTFSPVDILGFSFGQNSAGNFSRYSSQVTIGAGSPQEWAERKPASAHRLQGGGSGRSRGSTCCLANLEAYKAAYGNILAQFRDHLIDELGDRQRFVFDEVLFLDAVLLVDLLHFPVYDLLDHRLRLASGARLLAIDLPLVIEDFPRYFLPAHVAPVQRRNVHGP